MREKIENLELGEYAEAHMVCGLLKLADQERNGHGLGIAVICVLDDYRVRIGKDRTRGLLFGELVIRYDELCSCLTDDPDILRDASELYTDPRRDVG